jgi:flavin reductase
MIDRQDFRSAMARLGAAVNIIATDGPAGRHGMTASAVCSVSDDPPSLLLCINRGSRMYDVLNGNGRLSVNVLAGHQEDLSAAFADRSLDMEARFGRADWTLLDRGMPALGGALATFGCRIAACTDAGSHGIFLCEVQHLLVGGAERGLVYFDRSYHHLPMRQATA